MNVIHSLVTRELQEHKAGFLWLPIGSLCFLILLMVGFLSLTNINIDMQVKTSSKHGDVSVARTLEEELSATGLLSKALNTIEEMPDQSKTRFFAAFRAASGYLFHSLFIFVAVFYLANTLFDERVDRSILFWKSMPTSDWQAVLSKFLTIWIVVPAVYIMAIAASQLALLLIISITGLFANTPVSGLWLNSGLVEGWLHLILGYLIQGLWMLPLYGWLLLISAWSNRNPILVATLAPVIPIMLEGTLFQSRYLLDWISTHLHIVAMPAFANTGESSMETTSVADTLAVAVQAEFYFGVLVGSLLIAGAIWFRRQKNEI